MAQTSSTRSAWILSVAIGFAGLALALACGGLLSTPSYGFVPSVPGGIRLLFDVAAILGFEQPDGLTDPHWLWSAARLATVLFAGLAAIASVDIVFQLYQPLSDLRRRLAFGLARLRGRKPAVLLGLGWVGGPLVAQLRRQGRPVFAVALEEADSWVREARHLGALVILGDATEPRILRQARVHAATEVFVATGHNARNVEVAGALLEASRGWRRRSRRKVRCYVHVGDPTFAETLARQEIWTRSSAHVELVPFSNQELAARDLFFRGPKPGPGPGPARAGLAIDPALAPTAAAREPFHLFVLGFGAMGQSVARYLARFGHFASCARPRLTVLDADDQAFRAFLQRYPAFAPPDLDLASASFRQPGADDWEVRAGRPAGRRHRLPESAAGAVEYAVHADFVALPADIASEALTDAILQRTAPIEGAAVRVAVRVAVRAAIVVCLEEERASFETSLRLQLALAAAVLEAEEAARPAAIPLYVYLPAERGLAQVLAETDEPAWGTTDHRARDRAFPLRAFGERDSVASHRAITGGRVRRHARQAEALYGILNQDQAVELHPDFPSSDLDAAVHAAIKCVALGIRIGAADALPAAAAHDRVLGALFTPEVSAEVAAVVRRAGDQVPVSALDGLSEPAQERVVLEARVGPVGEGDHGRLAAVVDRTVRRLEEALAAWGLDPELPAKMEHNRWMGERLLRGWRFGARDNSLRQRMGMVPWRDLPARFRRNDRVSLARHLVLEQAEGRIAYWAPASGGKNP